MDSTPRRLPQGYPRPTVIRRPRPRRRWRFRWGIVWVLGTIFLAAWLVSGIRPAVSWDDIMDLLRVRNRERYTQLAVLGVTICGGLGIARVLGYGRKSE